MAKREALGRGLGALLGDTGDVNQNTEFRNIPPAERSNPASICDVPLSQIVPNPEQPRLSFDEEGLLELADSIRTLGIIQPLTLRKIGPSQYQIISGERRFRAAKLARLQTVPAYIREADDALMLEMAIVENIQREDLDAIETALGFQRLMDECNLTQEEMASRIGKKRSTVANYLRLLKLPIEIQKAIKTDRISMGHAKALLSLEDKALQLELCELTIRKELNVRQLEEKVRQISVPAPAPESDKEQQVTYPDSYYRIADIIGQYFDKGVSFKRTGSGGGTMTVRFRNDNELDAFLKVIEDKQL
ncbi:MAG: ParB/RepB/Spo0J family partition protein [Bacteroidales bacterium]|nr:ParB/RepB/Spo0J family partition protein [Bacteroidales bacterium]